TRRFIKLQRRPDGFQAVIPICKTFPYERISDEKFAVRSFPRKAGGSYRRTIRRWSFVFWPIFLQTNGWLKRFRQEKIFIAGLRPPCSACRSMQSRRSNESARKR